MAMKFHEWTVAGFALNIVAKYNYKKEIVDISGEQVW